MNENEKKFTLILAVESYGEDGAVHSIEWALVELTPTVVEHILLAVSATHALAELLDRCERPGLAEAQFFVHHYDVRFVEASQVTFHDLDDLPGRTVVRRGPEAATDLYKGWGWCIVEGGYDGLLELRPAIDDDELAYQNDMMVRLVCTGERAEWEATPAQGDGGYNTWSVDHDDLLELAKLLRTEVTVEPINATISVGGD